MRIPIGKRVFEPSGPGVLAVLAVVAGCLALGYWQIERGREKRDLLRAFAAGTVTTTDLAGRDSRGLPRYQHVRVSGHYLPDRQVLLDAMPSADGVAGYRVLTPFERADGRGEIVVDRGWVPIGPSRDRLPDVSVGGGPRTVRGRLDNLPVPGLRLGSPISDADAGWPRVMLFPTLSDLETALATRLAPHVLLLDRDLEDGYEREWRPAIGFGPERHLVYAIQWFALALAAVVTFVVVSLRRPAGPVEGGA